MIYYNDLEKISFMPPSAVTLGKFDGLHIGHQKLIENAKKIAKAKKLKVAMFTFDIPPQVKIGNSGYNLIVTRNEKLHLAEKFGVDVLIECPFNDRIRNMSAPDFLRDILIDKLNTKAIVAGVDFRFGKDRQGDAKFLEANTPRLGIDLSIVEKVRDGGREISSTYVREELARGNIENANRLLGYEFFIMGEIVSGAHIGKNLGFPTINIAPTPDKLLPPNGVYASITEIEGTTYDSISNIGVKPTVSGKELGVETFILDFSGDLYGKKAAVKLLQFMRDEIKFASVSELKEQIAADIRSRKGIK